MVVGSSLYIADDAYIRNGSDTKCADLQYLNQYTCTAKNRVMTFPQQESCKNSVDFVTPSTWLEADSTDVCRLNVKHSKISVLMKPATTLIGTLLKIQFDFFLNIWCTKYLELNHMLCSTAMIEPFIFTSHLGKMKIIPAYLHSSSLAKGYDTLYSSSLLTSLDGFP